MILNIIISNTNVDYADQNFVKVVVIFSAPYKVLRYNLNSGFSKVIVLYLLRIDRMMILL